MKRYKFTCYLNNTDYQAVRKSATFAHNFSRNLETGDVTFTTTNPRKLCADLGKLIDFGATSASEVLDVQVEFVYG